MATVYDALGAEVTVVEMLDQLIPGCDADLVKVLHKRIAGRYEAIHLGTEVKSVEPRGDGLEVELSGGGGLRYDQVLVAVGRRPAARRPRSRAGRRGGRRARLHPGRRQMRTNVAWIYAIGDVVGRRCSPIRPPTRARWPPR